MKIVKKSSSTEKNIFSYNSSPGNKSVMRVKASLFRVSRTKKREGALIRGRALNRENMVTLDKKIKARMKDKKKGFQLVFVTQAPAANCYGAPNHSLLQCPQPLVDTGPPTICHWPCTK